MRQYVVQIDDELSRQVDLLVVTGIVQSRSDAVRRGLRRLVDDERPRAVGAAIVEGYRRVPQKADDLG